jgi:cullin-5
LKILNAGAWSRGRDKCHISFPSEIDDLIPEMEEFYKTKHVGRKLNWAHNWSSAVVTFANAKGKYELEISAFQMAILFGFNERPKEKISLEGLRLATELPEADLSRTLLSLVMNPKVKLQVLLTDCEPINPKNFNDSTMFWINQDFAVIKVSAFSDSLNYNFRATNLNRVDVSILSTVSTCRRRILTTRPMKKSCVCANSVFRKPL